MNIRRSTLAFYGVRHLLGGRLWTPAGAPDDADTLHLWQEQQTIAWCLARMLAWGFVFRLLARLRKYL